MSIWGDSKKKKRNRIANHRVTHEALRELALKVDRLAEAVQVLVMRPSVDAKTYEHGPERDAVKAVKLVPRASGLSDVSDMIVGRS